MTTGKKKIAKAYLHHDVGPFRVEVPLPEVLESQKIVAEALRNVSVFIMESDLVIARAPASGRIGYTSEEELKSE